MQCGFDEGGEQGREQNNAVLEGLLPGPTHPEKRRQVLASPQRG